MNELVTSASAARRLSRAAAWLGQQSPRAPALIVGATAEAAAEVVRGAPVAAAFGWHRLSLGRLAALLAAEELGNRGLATLGGLGVEAVCARLIHARRGSLGKLDPIAGQPGLARALARSLQELRLAGARPASLSLLPLLEAYEAELLRLRLADRADVFRFAIERKQHPLLGLPTLLVDVPVTSSLERALVARLAGSLLATVPRGDDLSLRHLSRALGVPAQEEPAGVGNPGNASLGAGSGAAGGATSGATSLGRVQENLFVERVGSQQPLGDDVLVLSAPGESRECVEIARLVLREAERGVPFDRMAVLLRAPSQYRALLEEALGRAGVPAYFARGTVQPSPAGRAFLSLLACAASGLSARRFAEYLSLGEVPDATPAGEPPAPPPSGDRWVPPDSELVSIQPEVVLAESAPDPDAPVIAGVLRAPFRWERLLVDAAVIGGRQRWERRLAGLAAELELRARQEDDDGRRERLQRDLKDLAALRAYALPLLDALTSLPSSANWGEWLEQLSALATRALREPQRVLSLLAELAPMAPVGPVGLEEVRLVLARRLTELCVPPSGRRYGRVFVAPVESVRGLSFDVVFVPGLAEKMFPQKVLQDPLLRDAERLSLEGLATTEDRVAAERLALRLAAGAASRKLVLSYPRLDLQQARPRVPSFYGLEVLRAAEGRLPGFAELARRAEISGGARIGWPAPRNPADAIDEAEHDLALLESAFRKPEQEVRGTAHYLLSVSPYLSRALRARARRWRRRWTQSDGLVDPSPEALAALQAHALGARSWSPTALQNYAACPYRFLLQAVHRLQPRVEPAGIDELDPLERGSLIHEVQFELLRELQAEGGLPLGPHNLSAARARLDDKLARIAARYQEKLNPAIDRVWQDGIASVRADLREWLNRADPAWTPWRFELSFGLTRDRDHRDAHSSEEPVVLDQGLRLRGSIDLVERAASGALRATDYKTGKKRADQGDVIRGGSTLQPALYALALEKLFPEVKVEGGRLYYSTFTGEFESVDVQLDGVTRDSVRAVAQTIGDALTHGFLPAAPAQRQCEWCDYQPVCGSQEEFRVGLKPKDRLEPLVKLRGMP